MFDDDQIYEAIENGSLRTAIHHLRNIVVAYRKNQVLTIGDLEGADKALTKMGVLNERET